MFAVFYKNEFVNFWGNSINSDWLLGTIQNYGWEPEQVKVIYFEQKPNPGAAIYFVDNKNIVEKIPSQMELEGKWTTIWTTGNVIAGQVYYENGQFKLNQ